MFDGHSSVVDSLKYYIMKPCMQMLKDIVLYLMVWIVTTIHIMWRVDVKVTKNVNKL